MKLTIFTPTYNRAYILGEAYESLKKQTNHNFEWLIIDDGSSDNTENLVKKFMEEEVIPIQYIKKKNGGQHTALNLAIETVDEGLLMILDSDDTLQENAVEKVLYWADTVTDKNFAGVSGLRIHKDGSVIGDKWLAEGDYIDATNLERKRYGLRGDKAEAYFVSVLKKYYPIPVFPGENDVEKGVLWNRIAADGYKIRWFNEGIYYCEYLSDGMTSNIEKNYIKNFQGYTSWVKENYNYQKNYLARIKSIAYYMHIARLKGVSNKYLMESFDINYMSLLFAKVIGELVSFRMKRVKR